MDTVHSKKVIEYNPQYQVQEYQIEPMMPTEDGILSIGFDPGTTHIGIALICGVSTYAYEVKISRNPDPVERILMVHRILNDSIHFTHPNAVMIIEGSSFGSSYRNTELAEVRASAVLWGISHDVKPRILPPMTIRKIVFGNGKIKADDRWKFIPPNAASALACAYCAHYSFLASTKE